MSCSLYSRSIRSLKGKSPVPPATTTILPGEVFASCNPSPLFSLRTILFTGP